MERIPTQKTTALLALLAFYPNRRHSREALSDLLWPDADPAAARDRLSQALVWLRRHLEPDGVPRGSILVTDRLSVQLAPEQLSTDVAEFEGALAAARKAGTREAKKAALAQAVEAYRGELLPGHYSDWVLTERRRLLGDYLAAIQGLIPLYEEEGDLEPAIAYARSAVIADPLREEAHIELIRLLKATGQNIAALRQYQEMESRLARELGVSPSEVSRNLIEPLRRETPTPPAPPPPTVPAFGVAPRPAALPTPLTRFFGRDHEIKRVQQIIQAEGARLVTLIGIGGSGKTRLSLAVGAEMADFYRGAVAFVPLADLDDARMIPTGLASALKLPGSAAGSPWESIIETLSVCPFLLILDNLEHLREDAAPLVRELLERVPTLTVLATSRQRLGLDGEREVAVASLPLPSPDAPLAEMDAYASIPLFIDRARAVRPEFTLTPANAAAIARVCARLDGIPLAVELCAAWAATLTPEQMLEHLDRRFDLLVSRRTDITPRHRTLRAALEYSYLQLPPDLQQLFTYLSVFRGGWTLEAAVEVASDTEETDTLSMLARLTELRERSLILAEEMRADGTAGTGAAMRYRMLETLREFAGEQLTYAERAIRRQAHATYFLKLAEQARAAVTEQDRERGLLRLDREQENLRTALAWSLDTNATEFGLRLGAAMGYYWSLRGPLSEGYDWLRKILDQLAADREAGKEPLSANLWAKVEGAMGYLAWAQGEYVVARAAHEQALTLRWDTEDEAGIAESLYHLGITSYRQGNFPRAQQDLEESLARARVINDRAGISRALLNLGNIAYEEQRYNEARPLFQQSLALERELGNRRRIAGALNNLALLMVEEEDFSGASTLFEEVIELYDETNDHYGMAIALANLGRTTRLAGNNQRARSLLNQGLKLAYDIGNRHILVHQLLQQGILDVAEGMPTRGALLLSAAYNFFGRIGGGEGMTTMKEYRETIATLREVLGEEAFEVIWAQGASLPLGQAVAEALIGPREVDQGVRENNLGESAVSE